MSWEQIPGELRRRRQWVNWRFETRKGELKPTKVLYIPGTQWRAKSNDPQTWAMFEKAVGAVASYDGIGFVFSDQDPYVGIDLDDAAGEDGEPTREALECVTAISTYWEWSPSGRGLHGIARGKLPPEGRRKGKIEVYERARFFTMTGKHLKGTPLRIAERGEEILQWHARVFRAKAESASKNGHRPAAPLDLGDIDLLNLARAAKNGIKFGSLFDQGDTSAHGGDDSSADLALCGMLAFWTGCDAARIDSLFRRSKLMRDKWERRDYRDRTIEKAISLCREVYTRRSEDPGPTDADAPPDGDESVAPRAWEAAGVSPPSPSLPGDVSHNSSYRNSAAVTVAAPSSHTADAAGKPGTMTDRANGERLARRFRDRIRYSKAMGWLIYDGARWRRDDRLDIHAFAKQAVCGIYAEASESRDEETRKGLAEWARKSDSVAQIQALVSLARSEPAIPIGTDDLDLDPWLLNVANGTLDLRTGQLRRHSPADLLTKLAPVVYDPDAQCPRWERFLLEIMVGRLDLVGYLRRWAGYALTADVSEQQLLFLHGMGENGKSLFLTILRELLGDYATVAAPGLLLERGRDEHQTRIADLWGRRLVTCVEVGEGKKLAEDLVKQLTGEFKLKARFMRQDQFEFPVEFKLLLAANHKPVIRGTDHAIWRRIPLVPFDVKFTADSDPRKDPYLVDALRGELPGILAWAVRGCLEWQAQRLAPPAVVVEATEAYRAEMDLIGDFLSECCVRERTCKAKSSALYSAYQQFTEGAGERWMSQKAFSAEMLARGFSKSHEESGKWFAGIGLQSEPAEDRRLSS